MLGVRSAQRSRDRSVERGRVFDAHALCGRLVVRARRGDGGRDRALLPFGLARRRGERRGQRRLGLGRMSLRLNHGRAGSGCRVGLLLLLLLQFGQLAMRRLRAGGEPLDLGALSLQLRGLLVVALLHLLQLLLELVGLKRSAGARGTGLERRKLAIVVAIVGQERLGLATATATATGIIRTGRLRLFVVGRRRVSRDRGRAVRVDLRARLRGARGGGFASRGDRGGGGALALGALGGRATLNVFERRLWARKSMSERVSESGNKNGESRSVCEACELLGQELHSTGNVTRDTKIRHKHVHT